MYIFAAGCQVQLPVCYVGQLGLAAGLLALPLTGELFPQSTYLCRVQSSVWRLPLYWPPSPLSTKRVCPPPAPKVGGNTLAGWWGGWGVNILEDARHRIGLFQYNLSTVIPIDRVKENGGGYRVGLLCALNFLGANGLQCTLSSIQYDWHVFRKKLLHCQTFEALPNILPALQLPSAVSTAYGLINFKDTKTKCRLYWCLVRVYRLEIQSVMLVFSTQLCELLHL